MIYHGKTLFEVTYTIADILVLITDVKKAISLCIHQNSADLRPENTKIEAFEATC